jgi:cytochrome c-type biogenesis protein CcmH
MMTRRSFLARVAGASAATLTRARDLGSQVSTRLQRVDSSNLFAMDQSAARTVQRPPRQGHAPAMTPEQRDEMEHHIRCQCGCTLDVYTCRTTDFACQVAPAMHRDVMALVDGGYSAQEILDAFVSTYGERALMAPKAEGFNLLGWAAPFVALLAGAIAVTAVIRRRVDPPAGPAEAAPVNVGASTEERARLDAAVRDDR